MSNWIEIEDPEDIDVSGGESGRDVEILYSSDSFGNNYISVPLEMLLKRLRDFQVIPEDR